MIGPVVALIRALSGGEVEDRAVVRLAKSLRGEGRTAAQLCDALARAIERVEGPRERGVPSGGVLALFVLFGAAGAASGLHALLGLVADRSLLFLLPLVGVLAPLLMVFREVFERRRRGSEAAAVAFELIRIGVAPMTALDVALFTAGRAASALRRALGEAPVPADAPDRARAATAALAAQLIRAPKPRGSVLPERPDGLTWLAIAGAIWVLLSFWALYTWVLGVGFAGGMSA